VDGPMNESSPAAEPGHFQEQVTHDDDGIMLADPKSRVRVRERRRRQYVRLAEQAMPLARYYRHHGGPLLAEPIGCYYVRGRWAA
jgi:hypothetical protein